MSEVLYKSKREAGGGNGGSLNQTARGGLMMSRGGNGGGALPPPRPATAGNAYSRPMSAPRERLQPPAALSSNAVLPRGMNRNISDSQRQQIMQSVAEKRRIKEAQFWGREPYVQSEKPVFWSESAYGQPCNDPRITTFGTGSRWKVQGPVPLKKSDAERTGWATAQMDALQKSLKSGVRLFDSNLNKSYPALNSTGKVEDVEKLSPEDRERILSMLPPPHRIHNLRMSLDRDVLHPMFEPWTQAIDPRLNAHQWRINSERCIRAALDVLLSKMKRHVRYEVMRMCKEARAPYTTEADYLRRGFQIVDPKRTELVSIQQFLQVWQNELQLREYDIAESKDPLTGKIHRKMISSRRILVDRNAAAAVFTLVGFNENGLMPYKPFIQRLASAPNRLASLSLLLDNENIGANGLKSDMDVAMAVSDCKIKYAKCQRGIFPPSEFQAELAFRSSKAPQAHMYLEYVHGYQGLDSMAPNLYYNYRGELVYFVAGLCVVLNIELDLKGGESQRYFFGHTNDVHCLTMHPNRRFAASGQQTTAGGRPYVCIWDTETCNLIQRIDHGKEDRAVIAACFSGSVTDGADPNDPHASLDLRGGELLVTVTADNKHTIYVWNWMKHHHNPLFKATYIPGWYYGPEKALPRLEATGMEFVNEKEKLGATEEMMAKLKLENELGAPHMAAQDPHPVIYEVANPECPIDFAKGLSERLPANVMERGDGSFELLSSMNGFNGTPPQVYGVLWNPFRPTDGSPGSEFVSYGLRHLKTWMVDDAGRWQEASGMFGSFPPQNIMSVCWIQAQHRGRAPGDCCLVTGFPDGKMGVWLPTYPTEAGKGYKLSQVFDAHEQGSPLLVNQDGMRVTAGCASLRLLLEPATDADAHRRPRLEKNMKVLSGGADGKVKTWAVCALPNGKRGATLELEGQEGDNHFQYNVLSPGALPDIEGVPIVRSIDFEPRVHGCIVVGTSQNDIYLLSPSGNSVLVSGQMGDVYEVAPFPLKERCNEFVTVDDEGNVYVWDAERKDLVRSASPEIGALVGIAISNAPIKETPLMRTWKPKGGQGFHIAVGSSKGKVAILDYDTLQPLMTIARCRGEVGEMKYSPIDDPTGEIQMLAAASNDLVIDIYNADFGYQHLSRCVGHGAAVLHVDWSLPLKAPPNTFMPSTTFGNKSNNMMQIKYKRVFMSQCAAREILYWDPFSGRKQPGDFRDLSMATWTGVFGFPVMGIWPDGSDRTDINACSRSRLGAPIWDAQDEIDDEPPAEQCADGLVGAGFLVTGDDYSTVKLFNYPAVWDDAPFKAFRGHCSHVTSVRFSADDRRVFSVGSNDKAILQWRTVGVNLEDRPKDLKLLKKASYVLQGRVDEANTRNWKVEMDEDGRMWARSGNTAGAMSASFRASRASADPADDLKASTNPRTTSNPPSAGQAPLLGPILEEPTAPAPITRRPSAPRPVEEPPSAPPPPAPVARTASRQTSSKAAPAPGEDLLELDDLPPPPAAAAPGPRPATTARPPADSFDLAPEDGERRGAVPERTPSLAPPSAAGGTSARPAAAAPPPPPVGGTGTGGPSRSRYGSTAESVDFEGGGPTPPLGGTRSRMDSEFPVHEEDTVEEEM